MSYKILSKKRMPSKDLLSFRRYTDLISFSTVQTPIFHNEVINDAKTRFEHNPEELLALIVPLMEKQNLSKLLKENMRGRKKSKSQG